MSKSALASEQAGHGKIFDGFALDQALERIAHWLPSQRPIKDFVHHNPLHMLQDRPFHEGIAIAAQVFGARRYLPLADYQARYRQGRISDFAIDWAIARNEPLHERRAALRRSLFVEDHSAHYPPVSLVDHGLRKRWLTHLEIDLHALVHPVLFRLLANFLDQGISRWTIARQGESFWNAVRRLAESSFVPLFPFQERDVQEVLRLNPEQAILHCLEKIVGKAAMFEQYLLEMLLAHPGWSGMVRVCETAPQLLLSRRDITLKALVAVELAIELAFLRRKRGEDFVPVMAVPAIDKAPTLSQVLAHPRVPQILKVWHEAMEFSLYAELLAALRWKALAGRETPPATPRTQVLFCIDDRECSLRRHLEEIDPTVQTFGAAGFFGIDFLYRGLDDAYPVAQCPVVVTPRHLVVEASTRAVRPPKRPSNGGVANLHCKPNSLLRGWLYTQTLGLGYAARLAWDVFRPGAKRLKIRRLGEVHSHTKLHLLRETDEPTADGHLLGFSYAEMAERIAGLLRTIGLTAGFAPLVVVVAHGSSSVNNPYFAAYDCGACAGKPGAPNARAFAWMANDPTVRDLLRERGINIPATTRFVAALHNTSRDEIVYFQEDAAQPPPDGFLDFQRVMNEALERNAHERCRWFELGPKAQDPALSHAHVQARAASIFEPRPELNHANNLYCVVARRELTRDLFLDRRAFLHSYDPDADPTGEILARILTAVIPVCGGINLEYLFSRIDNAIYGAESKLPHNVIGLLGVANGVEGDLLTGLPSQMIEVHEPARLLIVVEQKAEIVAAACQRLGTLKTWLDNEWVLLASCHPSTREILFFSKNGFLPLSLAQAAAVPSGSTSQDIFRGQTATIPVHHLVKRRT